jgi:putative ABC transport system substrate-binding protein
MNRRDFVRTVVYAVVAAPLIARAQPAVNVRRIGTLSPGEPDSPAEIQQTSSVLAKRGWIERKNLVVERRYARGSPELLHPLAEELVRLRVELIVTWGTAATRAARSATNTIPIVFWSVGDPVGAGLVASLARPGGNVTGYSIASPEVDAKRVAILREWLPSLQHVGVLENSSNPYFRAARNGLEQACQLLGIQPIFVEVASAGEIAAAVAEVARRGAQGLLVPPDTLFSENQQEIMQAALRHRLPTTVSRLYVRETGALVSYAPIESDHDERAAAFIDRILRGAKPAELPVEQPTRFELIINLKTAKALGITVPPNLLARAHEVIE